MAMFCERCRTPGANENQGQRSRRKVRGARCARCGAYLGAARAAPRDGKVDTHDHLARFGLAITGDPLLELNRGA